jgi:nitrate/nitrite transport system substrate-binding protein
MTQESEPQGPRPMTRRDALRRGTALALAGSSAALLAACGDDESATSPAGSSGSTPKASGKPIKIGFIALTDAASVIMADKLGYYAKRGLNVEVVKQASWPATRDALLNGDIDAAHCLFGMPFSVATGITGKAGTSDLQIAMVLNENGQAITLEKKLAAAGYADLDKAKAAINGGKGYTFAMTFPGGTHDVWLRYWLLAQGIDLSVPKIIPIPPPQMVANMKVGNMNGYCVGEPWGAVAVQQGIGFTTIATQDIWRNHPEKALVVNSKFASSRKDELKQVMGAVLDASKWLDVLPNRKEAAIGIGTPAYVNAKPEDIEGRLMGRYNLGAGLGSKTYGGDTMRFFRDGATNFPRLSHGIWFMAQYQRMGYLKSAPAYEKIAKSLILTDLYKEVAEAEKVDVPDDDMKPFVVELDDAQFDPTKPEEEAKRA